ncbi:RsmB/NOP family class I SAM-dependent RNA methyltransferase [Pseudoruegeria sp. HB172150]|uniref:RsmB/NOP family class I SAM-dependent RNA methyltransferase n=1 Tax=Pseudoruegeria sp. HB172150 TaxID=2721164 RepID=UPI001555829F|nr:RsmB/NOP family class I SAM-dependent RNA methyltransferase [Pseudoruegeria sp. HB172150]
MTPGARIAAAIAVLDEVLAGAPAERVLTNWARNNRYAGSGDRAAIRDHVYDALRCRLSFAWLGGSETGRGLMIGAARAAGMDAGTLFSGEGYAPAPLTNAETEERVLDAAPEAVLLDTPEWLLALTRESLGDKAEPVLATMRRRAPVFLRVNAALTNREEAQASLARDGIETVAHDLSPWALEVTKNPRRVKASRAYREGQVELQDLSSQAACAALGVVPGKRVLDFCAGGGGKALAMAALGAEVVAHDAEPRRMRDLPVRAERAGARIGLAETVELAEMGPFDLVLCDAPCSGSGTWRRTPEAKWRLTADDLAALVALQADILEQALPLVAPNGRLAYTTCSLLESENGRQVAALQRAHPEVILVSEQSFTPLSEGDGFYCAILEVFRNPAAAV